MNKTELITYIRTLADELNEAPEGLFTDTELGAFIDVARLKVELDLIEYIPWYFRKKKDFNFTKNKDSYSVANDLLITDLFLFENIVKHESGKKPTPLIYLEDPSEELNDYGDAGESGEPRVFWREGEDTVGVWPNPDDSYSYRAWYYQQIPKITDSIPLPESLHELLALEVLLKWYIRDENSVNYTKITTKYNEILMRGAYELQAAQGLTYRMRPSIKESIN